MNNRIKKNKMEVQTAAIYLFVVYVIYKLIDYLLRIPIFGRLNEKYILVTGCDSGFGHEIAKRLDKLGCHVFATCLSEEGETKLKKSCSSRLCTLYMDVTKVETIEKAYDEVSKAVPQERGLWGVLNNAGIICAICPDEWFSLNDYRKLSDVNLFGLIAVTKTFLPLVKRGGGGRIVNTSSLSGRISFPGITPYNIAKYGVEAFSDSIRRQLTIFNVSVHLVEPGNFNTGLIDLEKMARDMRDMYHRLPRDVQEEFGEEYRETYIEQMTKRIIWSENIHKVVDAYEHALLGKYPRIRYMVGLDCKILIPLLNLIPDWLFDNIWNYAFRLAGLVPKAVS